VRLQRSIHNLAYRGVVAYRPRRLSAKAVLKRGAISLTVTVDDRLFQMCDGQTENAM